MSNVREIIPKIERLERNSRVAVPFVFLGLLVVFGTLLYCSIKLSKMRAEIVSGEAKLSELNDTISGTEKELANLKAQVNSVKAELGELYRSSEASPADQEKIASALEKTDKLEESLTRTSARLTSIIPRVYFHISSDSQRDQAQRVADGLREKTGFVVPGIERVRGPQRNELRYFRASEQETAQLIADALESLGLDAAPTYVRGYESSNKIRPMHFEVWYGRP